MGKSYKEQREWELKRGLETDRIKTKKSKLKDRFIEDIDWEYEYSDEESEIEKEDKHIKKYKKEDKEY
jgi:hypothetical protein